MNAIAFSSKIHQFKRSDRREPAANATPACRIFSIVSFKMEFLFPIKFICLNSDRRDRRERNACLPNL
jgi:hypothetical protein